MKPPAQARPKTLSEPLSRRHSAWLWLSSLSGLAPLSAHLPGWTSLLVILLFAWHLAVWRGLSPSPPRWLLSALAVAGGLAIVLHFHTLFGRNPGVSLLALLTALKLLEMRSVRDAQVQLLLNFFIVDSLFLFDQGLPSAAMAIVSATLSCVALLYLNNPKQERAAAFKLAAQMLAQATPFMLFLFLLFPRISGPLWGLPKDAHGSLSGLSETMSPGSISFLSQSDAIAFRVSFAGNQPPQGELYWRGPVLERFDGQSWSARPSRLQKTLPYTSTARVIDYQVTLEANGRSWLFALEMPTLVPADALISADYQLLAREPLLARKSYAMRSSPDIVAGAGESPQELRRALALPARGNPRSRALAVAWRAELGTDDRAIVQRLLRLYREQNFIYTLMPPLLGEEAMDEFLFDTRRGFCEHYAASFVFMMRAAGIPARVVTGYQGGEINPLDKTLIVRQSDAHAWAEVWFKDYGWQRVDPTAAIAPGRIEFNLAAALPAGEPLPLLARPALLWVHEVRYGWEALGNAWNQGVLGYNPLRQRELLARLGMAQPDWARMTLVLSLLCTLTLTAFAAWALKSWQRPDPAVAAWRRLSSKLAARGLARRAWEGPQDYAARVGQALPECEREIARIAELYQRLRYARLNAPDSLEELKMLVGKFKC